ncbi:SCP2 sterol-binding domain-containing protein [Streptomyces polyrhachis]|uniref:SCP2 sterol-binding domain-containing protein n=1 Tax=Streptomyces polyrhachis TaxID=1282885 RepID=A0ABW2GFL9_9ACTN
MAGTTVEDCRAALERLSASMGAAQGDLRKAASLDRSLSCEITDLDTTFTGRLRDGRIQDIRAVAGPPPGKAQIRLAMSGDDLRALVDGRLNFAKAWASGRVKVHASLPDLLRLRSLL